MHTASATNVDIQASIMHLESMLQVILERVEWLQDVMRELYDSDDESGEEESESEGPDTKDSDAETDLGSQDTWSEEEDGSYESSFIDDDEAEHTMMSEDGEYEPSESSE